MKVNKASIQTVLARISNLGFAGSGWHGDAIDYAGQAIRGIGYHVGFKKFTKMSLKVENFKAIIPSCIETVTKVSNEGCPLLLVYDDENICCDIKKTPASPVDITEYNEIVDNINYLKSQIEEQKTIGVDDVTLMNSLSAELNKAYALIGTFGSLGRNSSFYKGEWFKTYNNVIEVSFEQGEIEVDGTMFDLDDDGYPYIVDTEKYSTAVFWYILYQMLLGEYDHPKLTWKDAEVRWEDYRGRAANEGKRLDKNQMERFARRWLSVSRDSRELYLR